MFTLSEITSRAFSNVQFSQSLKSSAAYNSEEYCTDANAPAIQTLRTMTTSLIEEDVRSYVENKIDIDVIKAGITKESISQYLAAAKIIDLLIPLKAMANTTFEIRRLCYMADKEINGGMNVTGINLVNVFAMPQKDQNDLYLLNGINPRHPDFDHLSASQSAEMRNKIYEYSQNQVLFHAEAAAIIEKIIDVFYRSVAELGKMLPVNTTTVLRGCSGAGKSYYLQNSPLSKKFEDISKILFSTNEIMNAIAEKFETTPDQNFLLGLGIRKKLEANIKKHNPYLPILQEAWFKTRGDIDSLFNVDEGRKLDIKDFDGPLRLITLRLLKRTSKTDSNSALLSLDVIERIFKEHRQSRLYLLDKLGPHDQYALQFSHSNQKIQWLTAQEAREFPFDLHEVENYKHTIITRDDVNQVGDHLEIYIGKTIEDAFKLSIQNNDSLV